jgi:hypothetical protein
VRALIAIVACGSIASAERRVNSLNAQPAVRVHYRRTPIVWEDISFGTRKHDGGKWQLGTGFVAGWEQTLPEVHLGYHVTDSILVRVRERFAAREAEVGFAPVSVKLDSQYLDIRLRVKLFVLGGGGITNDRDGMGHVGLVLRTAPIAGVDRVTFEAGVRQSFVPQPITQGCAAISIFL